MQKMYSFYFQATLLREKIWFVVGALKSQENLCFDRALHKELNIFEFFVPEARLFEFLQCIRWFEQQGYLSNLVQKPNRVELEGKI